MDEMTDLMSPPIVSRRSCASVPVTEADRWGPRPPDTPEDYAQWSENRPRPHAGRRYDRSNFTRHGGRDKQNETAAVANENVMESIELESNRLIGMRSLANDLQARGRQSLNAQLRLEDENQSLRERLARSNDNRRAFEQSRDELMGGLATAEEERDRFRGQRDVAQNEVDRLRLQIDEPEEELNQRQEENQAFGQSLAREVGLQEQVRVLTESEANLRAELQSATTRADQLQTDNDRFVDDREQLELERNHYEDERDRQRDQNHNLQAQVQHLTNQLAAAQNLAAQNLAAQNLAARNLAAQNLAAQALAAQPTVNQVPVNAAPILHAPVPNPPIAAPPAGPVRGAGRGRARGGTRGRGGRGGGNVVQAVRDQPKRACKVVKTYKK